MRLEGLVYYKSCEVCGVSLTEEEFYNQDGMCPTCFNEYFKEAIKKGIS